MLLAQVPFPMAASLLVPILSAALLTIILGVVVGVTLLFWRPVAESEPTADADMTIDIGALEQGGPKRGPRLEFYGTPVRLVVLVLAPVGREGELPESNELSEIVGQLLPDFMDVVAAHAPIFRRWPPQLSAHGFEQSFFNNMALPGNRGKGTPWCSVAGKFTADSTQYLVGLVCCADRPNALGQATVQHEGQWLDVLRIRDV